MVSFSNVNVSEELGRSGPGVADAIVVLSPRERERERERRERERERREGKTIIAPAGEMER